MRVIDYDKIEEWSPWFEGITSSIAPGDLMESLRDGNPEFMEDARDHIIGAIGRERLVEHLNRELADYAIRVYHGTARPRPSCGKFEPRGSARSNLLIAGGRSLRSSANIRRGHPIRKRCSMPSCTVLGRAGKKLGLAAARITTCMYAFYGQGSCWAAIII